MNTLTIKDIRDHFSEAIHNVENGEETIITRYGKPVAKLVPIDDTSTPFPDLTEFRNSLKVKSGKIDSAKLMRQMRDEERF